MGPKTPTLDDRDYDELRESLVRRISVHSETWTDHNPGDPGIALLELFAHLGERLIDRINDVPNRAQMQFLELLGISLDPARPARTWVQFEVKGEEVELIPMDPSTARLRVSAGDIEFQQLDELAVFPVECQPIVKLDSGVDWSEVAGFDLFRNSLEVHLDHTVIPASTSIKQGGTTPEEEVEASPYEPHRLPPIENGVLPEALSLATTADHSLWLPISIPESVDEQPDIGKLASARHEIAGHTLCVGIRVDEQLDGPGEFEHCPNSSQSSDEPEVVWQIATGRFGKDDRIDQLVYERVTVESDPTYGLTRSGIVKLRLPADAADFGRWHFDDEVLTNPPHSPLDRDLRGVGDAPPPLADAKSEQRVITWLRVFRPDHPHPSIRWAGINVMDVEQAITAPPEKLGIGDGTPGQTWTLANQPVLQDSVTVQIRVHGEEWSTCERVDDLAYSGPDDLAFVLDAVVGIIRFGDGLRGRMPQPGEAVRVLSYRYSQGEDGNVAPGAIQKISRVPTGTQLDLKVTNHLAASGGEDAETVHEGRERIPDQIRHRERAVATADFQDLAMETPGIDVGRVEVLPRHKPDERLDGVPGVVSLVVLPAYDAANPEQPTPDREFLRRICEYLEPRRLVTTELYVTPPEYIPVWISISVEAEKGYGRQTVQRWVELGIRQYLAPLPPYGPAGRGWPFGRDVRARDIQAAALQVEGVEVVNDVRLLGPRETFDRIIPRGDRRNQAIEDVQKQIEHGEIELDQATQSASLMHWPTWPCGDDEEVLLQKWQLPVVRRVDVAVGTESAPVIDRTGDPRRPPSEKQPIPVPVEKEEC